MDSEDLIRGLGGGRRVRSHHGIHPESIMSVIWSARRAYLTGDYESALEYLGVALHYVQDKCVVRARGRLRRVHNRVERTVLFLELPVEAIREGFGRTECSPVFIKSILYSIKPSADPVEALRNACYYSPLVAGAVYNPSKPPRDPLEKYEEGKALPGISTSTSILRATHTVLASIGNILHCGTLFITIIILQLCRP